MSDIVLAVHNIVRWVVLILLILVVVRAFIGWFGKREWSEMDRKLGTYTTIGIDIQLRLGVLLYIFFSPMTKTAFQDMSSAMQVNDVRFFVFEHAMIMLLAVVSAHLGSMLPKRTDDSTAKYRRAAIWFTLALLLVLAGMPWFRPLFPGL